MPPETPARAVPRPLYFFTTLSTRERSRRQGLGATAAECRRSILRGDLPADVTQYGRSGAQADGTGDGGWKVRRVRRRCRLLHNGGVTHQDGGRRPAALQASGSAEQPGLPRSDGTSTTERVLQYLVDGLAQGRYEPGQAVNAARICEELGLSKAPVREAIHVLAGEGVIILHRNRGAIIRDLSPEELRQLWQLFALNIGREIRLVAGQPLTPGDMAAIASAMRNISDAGSATAPDALEFLRAFHALHNVFASLCPNSFIVPGQIRRLAEFWLPYIIRHVPVQRHLSTYVQNYRRLTDAVLAGDGPGAEAAFHYHAEWSSRLLAAPEATEARWGRP